MKRTVVMDKTKCGILFLSIVGLLLLWLFKATTEISPVKAELLKMPLSQATWILLAT